VCGERAVGLAAGSSPDVVLMDLRMPDLGGIEATPSVVDGALCVRVPTERLGTGSVRDDERINHGQERQPS
jgi:CheY-like chemotaxis protein